MTRRRLAWFLLLLAALVLLPIGLVVWNEVKLATGKEVLLEVRPVDPNDPFRGEYVALSYPIARTRLPAGVGTGDTVYVVLVPGDRVWRAAGVVRDRPARGTFIRGRAGGFPGIEFGIETFYVEEGDARRYEDAIRRGAVEAKVVLDDGGGAKLRDLLIRE
ncbi:MAG: GDYXXLXY domain-containing protein [Gaiellaceae bacterium]